MYESFEIKKLYVALGARSIDSEKTSWVAYSPTENELTARDWEKATELAKEGWELVSVVPVTGAFKKEDEYFQKHSGDLEVVTASYSYTFGYTLFFKRKKVQIPTLPR